MKRTNLLLMLAALAIGCASNSYWAHPDKGEQAFHRDRAKCLTMMEGVDSDYPSASDDNESAEESGAVFGDGSIARQISVSQRREAIFRSCMRGRGWQLVEE